MSIADPTDPKFKPVPELDDWLRTHDFPPKVHGKASKSYWRESARQIITEILAKTRDSEPEDRLKAIDEAYPFGTRLGWPYKCWLEERNAVKNGELGIKEQK